MRSRDPCRTGISISLTSPPVDPWVESSAAEIARHAERELEALVGVSSPSGDVPGAEEAVTLCAAFAPAEAAVERVSCSTKGYADDLVLRLTGTGTRRLLLIGHLDTVVSNDSHRPVERDGDRLIGSGTVDMKGGVVLSIGCCARSPHGPRAMPRQSSCSSTTRNGASGTSSTRATSRVWTPASASRPASSRREGRRAWWSSARPPAR